MSNENEGEDAFSPSILAPPIDLTTLGATTELPEDHTHPIYNHTEPRDIYGCEGNDKNREAMRVINMERDIVSLKRQVQLLTQRLMMIESNNTARGNIQNE